MSSTKSSDINLDKQAVEAVTALFDVLIDMDLERKKQRKEDTSGRHDKDTTKSPRPNETRLRAV